MKLDAWLYPTPHEVVTSEKTLWHFDRFVMVDVMLAIDKLCNFNPLFNRSYQISHHNNDVCDYKFLEIIFF